MCQAGLALPLAPRCLIPEPLCFGTGASTASPNVTVALTPRLSAAAFSVT